MWCIYSWVDLENNRVVKATGPERRFAASWKPLKTGALLRLTLDGAPLSVAWGQPSRGQWAAGVGVAGEGDGAIVWRDGAPLGCPGPWFGGWSFAGAQRWVLPKVLGWWHDGRTFVAGFGEDAEQSLARISDAEPAIGALRATAQPGSRARWSALVDAALGEIAAGALSKVVVARRIAVEATRPFEERRVLEALEARFPTCRTFLHREDDGSAFVGATPETLCRVRGRVLETEALAGTGEGDELLASAKDLREHAWVVESIVETLRPLTSTVEVEALGIKQLANVAHLRTPIRAQLRAGVEPIDAARALHPTPAVGGVPRAAALEFLRAHEGFDRGWYAGAIGARGENGLELCAGIRSARVSGARATVYAGAGVIAGSTPEGEWLETERKAQALLGALGVGAERSG